MEKCVIVINNNGELVWNSDQLEGEALDQALSDARQKYQGLDVHIGYVGEAKLLSEAKSSV